MFAKLQARGTELANGRAAARRELLAVRLEEKVPNGVRVQREQDRIVLSGRGLVRRFALDPLVRWLVAEARDEQ